MILSKLLIGNNKNNMQKSMIWNLVASVEYSFQSAVLLLIVTRIGGMEEAGTFMIAYTFTQMMATIGSYGMRDFQVSDSKQEYAFTTYFTSRILTVFAMIIMCLSYAFFQKYTGDKLLCVLLLCLYRTIEDVEDVFHGEMQRNMRLDIAAKIKALRIMAATMLFAFTYLYTSNLVSACLSITITALLFSILMNLSVAGEFPKLCLKFHFEKVWVLLRTCFPVCAGGFLYNYLVNAPKYAIDRNLSEEKQALFNILFMPIFAVNMLSSFVFVPQIANMSIEWGRKNYVRFIKAVGRQLGCIVILTVTIIGMGAWIGLDMLSLIYDIELEAYKSLFIILLLFGGVAAGAVFMVSVLTIIRKQRIILFAYGFIVGITMLCADGLVLKFDLWGAGLLYGIDMGLLFIIFCVCVLVELIKRKGEEHGIVDGVFN